jgi:hypothetical protein
MTTEEDVRRTLLVEAQIELLLLDLEQRAEQVRQLKVFEGKRLAIQAVTAAGALLAAGGVVGGLLVRLMSGHGG